MGPAPLKAVLFDFDYTLADSAVGVIDCVRYAQRRMGLDLSGEEEIRRTIGLSVPDIVATLNGEAERGRSGEFGRLFLERADRVMAAGTVVFEAVPGVLEELHARGVACAIASTKYRYRIEGILDREGLRHLVGAVVGAEDVAEHKPDPECLHLALERLGVDAAESLYVGDSLPDAEAARRGGIRFVAVLSGTTGAPAFAPYAPLALLDGVAQLPGWLREQRLAPEAVHG